MFFINRLPVLRSSFIKTQFELINQRFYSNKTASKPIVKNHCIVSTVGAQYSGKTTLTEALRIVSAQQLNVDVDSSIINSGTSDAVYSRYQVDQTQIVQIDVESKSHKNLITSSYGSDIGIVVIDASKGMTPETKEHIIVLEYHGIKEFIVFINKSDLNTDDEMKELIIDEVKDFFKKRDLSLSDDSIVYGSALNAIERAEHKSIEDEQPIVNVLKLIGLKSNNLNREEQLNKPALYSIKKAHTKLNKGTEVTGYIRQGRLKRGDIVKICGFERIFKTKILEIESFKEQLDSVQPGISAALLLKSIKRDDIRRGMAVIHENNDEIQLTDHFRANVQLFRPDEQGLEIEPMSDDTIFHLHSRTMSVRSIVKIEDMKNLTPGENGIVSFKLLKSMPMENKMKFLIRCRNTIGVGEITELLPSFEIEFLNKAKRSS